MSVKKSDENMNHLCEDCLRHCKQDVAVVMVQCKRYLPRPFKVNKVKQEQLTLFGADPED